MEDSRPRVKEIEARLEDYLGRGQRLFATSSFQTNSVVLLHLLSELAPSVPVYFLNTGYHFPETLAFKRKLTERLGLRVLDVFSPVSRIHQRDERGRLLFASDPDYCCHLNKVASLDPVLAEHDVWISGVRAAQSEFRSRMSSEEPGRNGILRYHPLLEWTSPMVWDYIVEHELPRHPLEDEGYVSVGCRPCTRKQDAGSGYDSRTGRWFGMNKTECGLHTDRGDAPTVDEPAGGDR